MRTGMIPILMALCYLATSLVWPQAPAALYRSDFRAGLSGFREIFHYEGEASLKTDTERPGPSGAPSLRVSFPTRTKTMIGVLLDVRPGQRLWVELAGAQDLQGDSRVAVSLKCVDEPAERQVWIPLGTFPASYEFAWVRCPLEVPGFAARVYLIVSVDDAIGRLWVADVAVMPLEIPPALEARLWANGPTTWGINDALALAYHKGRDPALSDTCAKLMAAAGATSARLSCWWGSREQLANDLNAGQAWATVDLRNGAYDFSELENQIDTLARYGLRADPVVVHGTPEWASGKTRVDLPPETASNWRARRRPFFPPRNWADYERFVFELVSHFKDRVRTWEVMNEPNTPDSGLQGGHGAYMDYLRHFYAAAKRADPACRVLCGRVGADWLGKMLEEDPKIVAYFDGLVVHPYSSSGAQSFAAARGLQLRMAREGLLKPLHVTEIGFFGGKWRDDRPPEVIQEEIASRLRQGLPELAKLSRHVSWWNSVFGSYAHGLLYDDGSCLRPLHQFWAFGEVTGRLSRAGGPVKAAVALQKESIHPGQQTIVTLLATNTSDAPQRIRFWPVGFVSGLGIALGDIRAEEWQGTLPPAGEHKVDFVVRPTPDAADRAFPVGLAVIADAGNSLALADLRIAPERDGR